MSGPIRKTSRKQRRQRSRRRLPNHGLQRYAALCPASHRCSAQLNSTSILEMSAWPWRTKIIKALPIAGTAAPLLTARQRAESPRPAHRLSSTQRPSAASPRLRSTEPCRWWELSAPQPCAAPRIAPHVNSTAFRSAPPVSPARPCRWQELRYVALRSAQLRIAALRNSSQRLSSALRRFFRRGHADGRTSTLHVLRLVPA